MRFIPSFYRLFSLPVTAKAAGLGRSAFGRRWPRPRLGTRALRFRLYPAGGVHAGKGLLTLPGFPFSVILVSWEGELLADVSTIAVSTCLCGVPTCLVCA